MKTTLLLVTLAALPAAAASAPVEVTLDQAVSLGLQHAPELVQADGAVRMASAAQLSAIGAWLPTLSVSAGTSLGGRAVDPATGSTAIDAPLAAGSGPAPSLNGAVSLGWDLFNGGRTLAQGSAAQAQAEAARAGLVSQRAAVTLTITRAFSDEARARALLDVQTSRIERAKQSVEAAERRAAVGSATKSDVLRAQLELTTATEAQRQAQTQLRAARFALGRLIGLDGEAAAKLDGPVQPRPLSETHEALVRDLVEDAPVVRAAEAAELAANAGVASARSAYLPSLRLNAGYDVSARTGEGTSVQNGWSVGLGLSFPLFDGFKREESMERANVAETVATSQLEALRRSIRADVESALGTLDLQQERIGFADEALTTAQEDLRVQQERYRLGASTMLDLLTSQSALVSADSNAVTTRFDYQVARAEVEALAGRSL